jgi:hypothetical protein
VHGADISPNSLTPRTKGRQVAQRRKKIPGLCVTDAEEEQDERDAYYYDTGPPKPKHIAYTDNYVLPYLWALMVRHGLDGKGWQMKIDKSIKTVVAFVEPTFKFIVISKYFLYRLPLRKLKELVIHEIAHAMVGISAAHGPAWQRAMRILGQVPHQYANVHPRDG